MYLNLQTFVFGQVVGESICTGPNSANHLLGTAIEQTTQTLYIMNASDDDDDVLMPDNIRHKEVYTH